MVFTLVPSWLAIGLLVVLPVGGIAAIAALVLLGPIMIKKSIDSDARWAGPLLSVGAILVCLCVIGVVIGTWVVAHFAVWDNSVPGQAQARSGHWEQRTALVNEWAGLPAYTERVEKARGDGIRSTAEPRIAVRCGSDEGMSVHIFPGDASFGGAVTLAVVADGTADSGQSLPAGSVSTHGLSTAADGTLALAQPQAAFNLLTSAGADTDLWAAPASTVRGGKVWRFDTDWAAERLASYRDCDEALAAALGGR